MSGLGSALATAMSGLRVTQAALSVVSSNVANSQTPGYVSETANQTETYSGGMAAGVETTGIDRQTNQYLLSQLQTETSGSGYADQISNVLTQLQNVYGTPGGQATLETALSNLSTAAQSLSTSAGSSAAQGALLTAAQNAAQQLNATSQGIQSLRSSVQQDIATSVTAANTAMAQIASYNSQLQGMSATDPAAATLEDQRDTAITQLSQLMGIRVSTGANNQVSVYTTSGAQLVGAQASTLSFNGPSTLTATNLYSTNPAQNTVGSITLTSPDGTKTDVTNSISSGQIGADVQLRDNTLVQAETQVDQLAATMSSAMSDVTTSGTAVTSGTQAGFSLDLSSLQPGNSINVTYTNTATNKQQQLTIVDVSDPAALPLPASSNPNDTVIGVNFSGGMASAVAQLNAALNGSNIQFSNPSGSTLQVLDNGTGAATVNSASTTTTTSSLTSGTAQLPLFTDGNALYTGAITVGGSQLTGYAGRITVNPAVVANPTSLSVYSTSPPTAAGDTTRSDFIASQLTTASFSYSPQTGLGSATSPMTGTIPDYLEQFLTQQANTASNATQLQQGQEVVVNTLQQSYNSSTGVSMDTQMANLIALQNSYAANAHVMAVVQSMFTTLLQAQS
jgi:flagellar hook-associated protein 1 FlgK